MPCALLGFKLFDEVRLSVCLLCGPALSGRLILGVPWHSPFASSTTVTLNQSEWDMINEQMNVSAQFAGVDIHLLYGGPLVSSGLSGRWEVPDCEGSHCRDNVSYRSRVTGWSPPGAFTLPDILMSVHLSLISLMMLRLFQSDQLRL